MGAYFNPADKIDTIGRKLVGSNYQSLVKQLHSDEVLFGHFQWVGRFHHSPHLFNAAEFAEFESEPMRICHGYYAVLVSDVKDIIYETQER